MELNLPQHIGFIMDGNGRWATQKNLPRSEGHKAGANAFRRICEYGCDIGIKNMTFYAFSTENWKRPQDEVSAIMNLFRDYLFEAQRRRRENEEKGMRLRCIGDRSGLPGDIVELFETAEKGSLDKTRTTVNIAVNYGGRAELLNSVRRLAQMAANGEILPGDITEADISAGLYTAGQPDPDLIIRPSGEYRLSNFLLWQSAYSELYVCDKLWPDFSTQDLDIALEAYSKRNRRFGNIK